MSNITPKPPAAVLDYGIDWECWLEDGDVITNSTWTVTPSGQLVVDSQSHSDTATLVWLSGGTLAEKYAATNTITTADGRTTQRSLDISVMNL